MGPKLRNTGSPKQPTVRFGPHAKFYHEGVGIQPQIIYAMTRITAVFFKRGLSIIWTSIVRGEDKVRFSLHPFGYGMDADTDRELPTDEWKAIGNSVADEVGPEYDVMVHDAGSGMHLHTEFDPEDDDHWTMQKGLWRSEWEDRNASKA